MKFNLTYLKARLKQGTVTIYEMHNAQPYSNAISHKNCKPKNHHPYCTLDHLTMRLSTCVRISIGIKDLNGFPPGSF